MALERPERNSLRLGGVALPVGLILRISSYLLILECALPQPASARAEPRWSWTGTYRFHPYAVAGAGGYLTAEPVQVSRNGFAVRHHFRPGITAGGGIYGFLPGGIGIEGRWHSVLRGDPERRRAALNILSAGVGINIP